MNTFVVIPFLITYQNHSKWQKQKKIGKKRCRLNLIVVVGRTRLLVFIGPDKALEDKLFLLPGIS